MTKPLADLRQLVGRTPKVRVGIVIAVGTNTVTVSSSAGLREFVVPNASSYTEGDKAKFQGQVFLGRIPSDANLPVYSV